LNKLVTGGHGLDWFTVLTLYLQSCCFLHLIVHNHGTRFMQALLTLGSMWWTSV